MFEKIAHRWLDVPPAAITRMKERAAVRCDVAHNNRIWAESQETASRKLLGLSPALQVSAPAAHIGMPVHTHSL